MLFSTRDSSSQSEDQTNLNTKTHSVLRSSRAHVQYERDFLHDAEGCPSREGGHRGADNQGKWGRVWEVTHE